ncbi:MAG: Ti-type conjugative transfer relaxase TraA [Myxococcota bacterium]
MAIYHLHAQIISRGKGRSVMAAAAYRAAEKLHDERQGRGHNYEKKLGVEHKEILAPDNAPSWVHDREQLWNQVEAAENRKDAQTAREIQVALPVELNNEQQVELVREFVKEQFVDRGMVADVCIHRDNPENPHAHIMLTTRPLDSNGEHGFGKKDRSWNAKDMLIEWREGWADALNRQLERAGHQVQVDHRSFEAQGIELEPMRKLGVRPEEAHKDGRDVILERMAEHDRIVRANGEAIRQDPELALDAITRQRASFTQRDVGRWLNTRTADAEQFKACLDGVMSSAEVVALGKDGRGQERFTTREMLEVERNMLDDAQRMAARQGHNVSDRAIRQAAEARPNLSSEQLEMLRHVAKDSGELAVVQGVAGAGKSYALGAAREAWEAQGYRVLGGALAGKAAEGLEISAGIRSRSLHAWEHSWKRGYDRLASKDVLVIDEAGMVGSRQMQRVLAEAERAGAKVVLVGDTRQLQAIEAGAPMRAIAERVGRVELGEVRRQQDDWQKKASEDLAQGRVAKALDAYEKAGRIHEHGSKSAAIAGVVERWNDDRQIYPKESHLMLAYRRDEVRALNDAARGMRQQAGELGADHRITTERGERDFATGDRIVFLKNDRRLGVKNGSLATIDKIRGNVMTVRVDGIGVDGSQRRIALDVREYNHLDHGYAVTAHKSQGVTVDRAHVLASDLFDQHAAYVALSRHRKQVDLHWSRDTFKDRGHMVRQLGRERMKDIALDHVGVERGNREWRQQIDRERQAPPPAEPPPARRAERDARGPVVITRAEIERDRQDLLEERADERKRSHTSMVDARKQVVALERAGPSKQLDEARAEYKKAKADWEPHRKERIAEIAQERKRERELDKDKGWER